ncbi:TetR/AcrR family transcriptional regulator [Agrobacterium tumefaciens]|uniref:TetR/AcrR family transcriptional regulator n=1 Tax=Agrobacterium tumefaciens TaxID=358 RepID=UPI0021D170E8|nr:hypothetical protein [Agrobacterium tumefaciens]UXS05501.1 hypothetical protein FY156_28615 [Agrobacterium tumefaciens]
MPDVRAWTPIRSLALFDSGVAKRSLYSCFPSKADLLRQVVLTYSDNTLGRLKFSKNDKRPLDELLYDGCIRILEIVLRPDVIAMERLVLSEAIRVPELTQGVQMARHQGALYLLAILEHSLAVPEGGRDVVSPFREPALLSSCRYSGEEELRQHYKVVMRPGF